MSGVGQRSWHVHPRVLCCPAPRGEAEACTPHQPTIHFHLCVCVCVYVQLVCYHRKKLVFVESFCRVKSLSLSGRLLYPLADEFIVSWEALTDRYSRAKYLGVLY